MFRHRMILSLVFVLLALASISGAYGQIPGIPRLPRIPIPSGSGEGHDQPHTPSIPDISNLIPHFPQQPPQQEPGYYPGYQPVPTQPQAEVAPPPNALPTKIVHPEPNAALPIVPVTSQMLADWHLETNQEIDKLIAQILSHIGGEHAAELNQAAEQAHEGQLSPQALTELVNALSSHVGGDAAIQEQISQDLFHLQGLSLLNEALIHAQPGLRVGALAKNVNIFFVINIPGVFIINVNVIIAPWWPGQGPWVGPNWWWWNGPPQQAWWQPIPIEPPVPDSNRTPITSGVLLLNRAETAVNYTVNGRSFGMQPGQRQALPDSSAWTVAFARGESYGTARYRLRDGSYRFAITADRGWELFRTTFDVTLTNASTSTPFHFVLNNRQQILAAGEQRQFKGAYPLYVKFDDSAGKVHQKALDSGVYQVVATDQGTLDIFAADAVFASKGAAEMAQQAAEQRINLFADPGEVTPALFRGSQSVGVTEPPWPATAPASPGLFGGAG